MPEGGGRRLGIMWSVAPSCRPPDDPISSLLMTAGLAAGALRKLRAYDRLR